MTEKRQDRHDRKKRQKTEKQGEDFFSQKQKRQAKNNKQPIYP